MEHPAPGSTTAKNRLGELAATAIAGNDILSSCLYVCGIAAVFAGFWAPLIFVAIAGVLYLYKHVYTEVVEALPLNGGAYNCLLNATSKNLAAVAGIMTTLSYMATSVISAKTASAYVGTVWPQLPILPMTAGIIVFFAILVAAGVKDSARVAKLIFFFHIFVLTLMVSTGVLLIMNTGWGYLPDNWRATQQMLAENGTLKMLFLAFAASLLGVSGFESSANFVEEQKPGIFRKTLRNMLLGVLLFNPLIAVVMLRSLPLVAIQHSQDFVLAETAVMVGGRALQYLVVADAFLVLSGAVLASFVGATGLLYRMTLDHCLPTRLFLPHLRRRNQNRVRIILGFAALCLSILVLTGGALLSLAGVYTISFLGVMTAFALGNLILRETRPDLKRPYRSPLLFAVGAATATTFGIIGNILIDARNVLYFSLYFLPALLIVMTMIYRDYILEALLHITQRWPKLQARVRPWFEHVIRPRILLFAHHPHKLYRSLEYIRRNETSRRITIIYCREPEDDTRALDKEFREYIDVFQRAQVFKNLDLSYEMEHNMPFGPELVRTYAQRFHINRNYIFIGSIHDSHHFSFEDLGGVRIIQ